MLAAGTSIDSYWAIYGQHQTPEVREILEMYRIGNTDAPEIQTQIDSGAILRFSPEPTSLINKILRLPTIRNVTLVLWLETQHLSTQRHLQRY